MICAGGMVLPAGALHLGTWPSGLWRAPAGHQRRRRLAALQELYVGIWQRITICGNALPTYLCAGAQCPNTILLGLHNSLADQDDTVCRLVVYSPFWIDNRTGFSLVFKDLDAPPILDTLPFLCAYPTSCANAARRAWGSQLRAANANAAPAGVLALGQSLFHCLSAAQDRKGAAADA